MEALWQGSECVRPLFHSLPLFVCFCVYFSSAQTEYVQIKYLVHGTDFIITDILYSYHRNLEL